MSTRSARSLLALVWSIAPMACTGAIGTPQGQPGAGGSGFSGSAGAPGMGTAGASGGPAGSGTAGAAAAGTAGVTGAAGASATGAAGTGAISGDPNAAGPMPLRRLTAREYLNTVRDLLGDTTSLAADDLPGDPDDLTNNAFPFRQPTNIGTVDAATFRDAAETLVKNAATRISTLLPCTPANAGAEAGCANQFITTFGLKAYRRPLTSAETAALTTVYQAARTTLALDFNGAIGVLLEAMLQSPAFLYHWEQDPGPAIRDGAVVQLGSYQLANRLSYFLWGSMPDKGLFDAAAGGQLSTPAGIDTQARRMLTDRKAEDMVADFLEDLLDVNTVAIRPKDPAYYSMWSPALASAMQAEFRLFAVSNILGTGRLGDLLTGTHSSVNQALAAVYGLSGVTGTALQPVTFNTAQRGGMLTLAGFLASHGVSDGSSPVLRGHAVMTRLMCQTVPDPPQNVPSAKPPTPGVTTRQRFEEHDMNPCTGACHAVMDPIGFGFEHYDGIGQYRTTDQGLPVDSRGAVSIDGQMRSFANALELGRILAESPQVQSCLATQMMRYALNRWDTAADRHSIEIARNGFRTGGLDLRTLMANVATTRTFRFRAPSAGEVLP